jgi:hypothetical protein
LSRASAFLFGRTGPSSSWLRNSPFILPPDPGVFGAAARPLFRGTHPPLRFASTSEYVPEPIAFPAGKASRLRFFPLRRLPNVPARFPWTILRARESPALRVSHPPGFGRPTELAKTFSGTCLSSQRPWGSPFEVFSPRRSHGLSAVLSSPAVRASRSAVELTGHSASGFRGFPPPWDP